MSGTDMSQAPSSTASEPLLFNRYRIHEQLGEGRLATVYRATDERLQRSVLVHLFRKNLVDQEALRKRFLDEASASARRSHSALLEVFDSGEAANRPFMVTEYAVGRPLNALGVLSIEDALLYIRQVVGAVAACQKAGVAYPPISSSNVILVDEGRVKLVESWQTPLSSVVLDLMHYRAPERIQGQAPSPANAVYALGILFYEMITGKRPVEGNDPQAVAQAHLTTVIPPISAERPLLYLPSLDALVAKAIARLPEQRIPDATAFATALDELRREIGNTTQRFEIAVPQRSLRNTLAELRLPMGYSNPLDQPRRRDPYPDQYADQYPDQADEDAFSPRAQGAPAQQRSPLGPGMSTQQIRRQSTRRSIAGGIAALFLLCVVIYGVYFVASFAVDQFFAIKLPQIQLPSLPSWISGQPEEILIVRADELNLRKGAGTDQEVIEKLPKGTMVTRIGGEETINETLWIEVRADLQGNSYEGWVSEPYLEKIDD